MSRLSRWMVGGLLLLGITYPLVIAGTIGAVSTCRNDILDWSAPGSRAHKDFGAFRQRFGENDLLFVSWPGCDLDDQRLEAFRIELETAEQQQYFQHVLCGQRAFEILIDEVGLTRMEAAGRLHGIFLNSENKFTGASISLTKSASKDRGAALRRIEEALEIAGVDANEARIAGPAYSIHALDMEGLWSPLRAVPFILLLSFALTWMFTERLDLAMAITAISSFSGLLTMAMVYVSGVPLNAVVWTLPTLVMLLTFSASLHFLGYYREALRKESDESTAERALWLAWQPTLYCALTTSAGLSSLLLSDTEPVRQFGAFGSVAVLVSCAIVLCCLPGWLTLRPLSADAAKGSSVIPSGFWTALAWFTQRRRAWIFLAAAILVVGFGTWIPRLRTSVNIRHLFPESNKVVQNTRWIEQNVCPLSSIELMLRFKSASNENDLERLRLLRQLGGRLRKHQDIEGIFSAATLTPEIPRSSTNIRGIVRRRMTVAKVKRQLPKFGLLVREGSEEAWRLSARVSNLAEIDYEQLIRDVEREVNATFFRNGNCVIPDEQLSFVATGRVPVFSAVERQFLSDLRTTYATAFVVISIVVLVVLRNAPACLLATMPNLFPAVTVLGATALLGHPLDVASLMTASVALGIAVDDTLHFTLWWRAKVLEGYTSSKAIVDAMEHCGAAMTQTSVICGVSVALYGFCGFLPTVRFGLLLSAMMFVALIGDLCLLPALLSTKFARRIIARITIDKSDSGRD